MDSGSDCVVLLKYFKQPYHSGQSSVAKLYFSYMFEPILSTSMCVTDTLRLAASPSETLCCLNCDCSVFVGFEDLSVSELILKNTEIVKVSQSCSYQNGYSGCMGESEWHSRDHLLLLLCWAGTAGASEVEPCCCSNLSTESVVFHLFTWVQLALDSLGYSRQEITLCQSVQASFAKIQSKQCDLSGHPWLPSLTLECSLCFWDSGLCFRICFEHLSIDSSLNLEDFL